MLSALAARAGELLVVLVIAGAVLAGVAAAGVWWLKRQVRRHMTRVWRAVAARAVLAATEAAASASRGLPGRSPARGAGSR